jgi:hypothetical protein
VGSESVKSAVLHVERDHSNAFAVGHDEVKRKVLNEEIGVVAEGLAIQGVQ